MNDLELAPSPVRVTNLPGAGGGVAFANVVAQREHDPELFVAASPATTLKLALGQYGRLTEDDVRWVAAVAAEYGVLAVSRDARWRDLGELMDDWRRDPGAIIVSGGGPMAGMDHMKVLLLTHEAGIDPRRVRYVPFDGGGEAMTALLGGFVQVFSGEASEVEGHVEASTLRVLTVLAPERLEGALASVPTARECGFPVEWITWRGFYVPAGVSQADYERWVAVMTRLVRSPEWARVRAANHLQPFFRAGAEFEALVRRQIADFRTAARDVGLAR